MQLGTIYYVLEFHKEQNFSDLITKKKKVISYVETMLIIVIQLFHDACIVQGISKGVQSEVVQVLDFQPGPGFPSLGNLLVLHAQEVSILMSNLVRTQELHSVFYDRTSELKQSSCLGIQTSMCHHFRYFKAPYCTF